MSLLKLEQRNNGFTFYFPAEMENMEQACQKVESLLHELGLQDHLFQVLLLVREMVNNAVIHGSAQNPFKMIRLSIDIKDWQIIIEVEDQGQGFDWKSKWNSCIPELEAECGRGLKIVKIYADSCCFNPKGNRVQAIKFIDKNR